MNYAQARDYIAQLTAQQGIVPGLEPMRQMLHRLGNPQDLLPYVHIAGTNGKGSTLAVTASVLRAAGYRVGTYSSPAVFCPRECWQVDGVMISEAAYAVWMTQLAQLRERMLAEGQMGPTAFEMETVLAFCWLAQQGCEIAVMECGMGGAEDATNVIRTTVVSVLTAIGMDHTRFLGDTLEQIAHAKGGIIKSGVPVVMQSQPAGVQREIAAICARTGSPCTVVRPEDLTNIHADAHSVTFDYGELRQAVAALPGLFQARNAATAIAAVRQLRDMFPVDEAAMRRGLRTVRWPGRMEQISSRPIIVIDGAHNPNAAQRLCESARQRWPGGGLVELVGVLADKDFSEVGRMMAPLARRIITVTPDNPRALDAQALAECLRQYHDKVTAADSVRQGLEQACREAGPNGTILAFGSLSWLGALRQAVEERQ